MAFQVLGAGAGQPRMQEKGSIQRWSSVRWSRQWLLENLVTRGEFFRRHSGYCSLQLLIQLGWEGLPRSPVHKTLHSSSWWRDLRQLDCRCRNNFYYWWPHGLQQSITQTWETRLVHFCKTYKCEECAPSFLYEKKLENTKRGLKDRIPRAGITANQL